MVKLGEDPPVNYKTCLKRRPVFYNPGELEISVQFDQLHFHTEDATIQNMHNAHGPGQALLDKSFFCNTTRGDQEFHFNVNSTSTSHCITQVQQGVSTGEDCHLVFPIPMEITQETKDFGETIRVKNINSKVERKLTWTGSHVVQVLAGSSTTAEAFVEERYINLEFSAKTVVSGNVSIIVTDPKKNDKVVKQCRKDIARIVKFYKENPLCGVIDKGEGFTWDLNNGTAIFDVYWCCFFQYGYKQLVRYSQELNLVE